MMEDIRALIQKVTVENKASEKDLEIAAKYYEDRIKSEPNNPVLWNNLGVILEKMGLIYKAEKMYRKANQINEDYEIAWFNLGNLLFTLGEEEEFMNCYEKVLMKTMDESIISSTLLNLSETKNLDKMRKRIKNRTKLKDMKSKYIYARILMEQEMFEDAAKIFRRICDEKHAQIWANLASCLYNDGDVDNAKNVLENALSIFPDNEELHNNFGYILMTEGNLKDALYQFDISLKINPEFVPALYNKAFALQMTGNLVDAKKYYAKVVELDPTNIVAMNNMGNVEYNLENYEESIKLFEKVLELDENYEIAINNIGNAYNKMGEYEKALEMHEKAIRINPKFDYAWYAKGYSLHGLGRDAEALKCVEKSIILNPEYPEAWELAGDILLSLGDIESAIERYDMAISLDNFFYESYIKKYDALLKIKSENEGRKTLERCIHVCKMDDSDVSRFFEAKCHYILGNYTKAEEILNNLVNKGYERAEVYNILAEIYEHIGDYEKAYLMNEKSFSHNRNKHNLTNICNLLLQMGLNDEAMHALQNNKDILDEEWYLYLKGKILYESGDDEGIKFIRKAWMMTENEEVGILLSQILVEMKKYDDAARIASKIAENNPKSLHAWLIAGISLYHMNDLNRAERCFEISLGMDDEISIIWEYLAKIKEKKGDIEKSVDIKKYIAENFTENGRRS